MKLFTRLRSARSQKIIFSFILFALALLAFVRPFYSTGALDQTGMLLLWASAIVFVQSFKRSSERDRNMAKTSAFITLLIGLILVNIDLLIGNAVILFTASLIVIDAIRQFVAFVRKKREGALYIPELLLFAGNVITLLAIFIFRGKTLDWLMALTGGLRIMQMAFEVLTSRLGVLSEVSEDVVASLHLKDVEGIPAIAQRIESEESVRAPIDKKWILSFLLILFFIHLGRIGLDRSSTGLLSPLIALIGDIVIAVIIAFCIILPIRSYLLRNVAKTFEKKLWKWTLAVPKDQRKSYSIRNLSQPFLENSLRFEIRMRKSGYSFRTAIRTALQIGLPYAALLAAIIPVFGMSWYFDTENWASGIWDSWAASRTDLWRSAMIRAVEPSADEKSFLLHPKGVSDAADFSFLVIGDPGEGDASQFILSDHVVILSQRPEIKFLVVSSDVVYPDGAMKDYERKFWLPMKGVTKPVYAIPGNHDWYDALDGFNATFLEAAAARSVMQARREADLKLTGTTKNKIDELIAEAGRLRKEYRVPTGFQKAPFFQVQTKDFAFITIETGVLRRIDDEQMNWLKKTLQASKGKFIFVLLGHPFYAAGEYQGSMNEDFLALHQLLRDNNVAIAMAGDTHDLEYYKELQRGKDTGKVMHHFVNGGGGAYLSIGAALKPKDKMPEKVWAHYPARDPLIQKIEDHTGWLKRPAWIWTKKYNGWPFSAEWLSAAFDYNKAPFFQSFMEIKVEPSKNQVRILPHGIFGQLRWSDIERSENLKSSSVADSSFAEWVFPLN